MAGLVSIKLRNTNTIIRVIPAVAISRVNGGTADYVNPLTKEIIDSSGAKPETAALSPVSDGASTGSQQNAPKKNSKGAR